MCVKLTLQVSVSTERGVLDLPLTTVSASYKGDKMTTTQQILAAKGLTDREILNIMMEQMAKQLAYAYEVGLKEGRSQNQ